MKNEKQKIIHRKQKWKTKIGKGNNYLKTKNQEQKWKKTKSDKNKELKI